jgi:hypothetical protein
MTDKQIYEAFLEARKGSEPTPKKEPIHGETGGERVKLVPRKEEETISNDELENSLNNEMLKITNEFIWIIDNDTLQLDGYFTISELEMIINIMKKNKNNDLEKNNK